MLSSMFSRLFTPAVTALPQGRIQHMSIQPWIRASVTHHCWVDRGNLEWEACPRLLLMTSVGNRTSDLLITGPLLYQLGQEILLQKNKAGISLISSVWHHRHRHRQQFMAPLADDLHKFLYVTLSYVMHM